MSAQVVRFTPLMDSTPPVPPQCDEIGNATRCNVTSYQRDRAFAVRLYRGETRCLIVNWNGALGLSRSIASVTFRMDNTWAIGMASAFIDGRTCGFTMTAAQPGLSAIKCAITTDNGEIYNQIVRAEVIDGSVLFGDEQFQSGGPQVLTTP